MSRLAGRVTFPGAAGAADTQSFTSEPQDARRAAGNRNQQEEIRPRGRGNVRYQGNYTDRFQTQERSEEMEERSDRGARHHNQNHQFDRQGPRGSDRSQKFDRSGRSDRMDPNETMERSDRRPTHHSQNHQFDRQGPRGLDRSQKFDRSDRSDRFDRVDRSDRSDRFQKPQGYFKPDRGADRTDRSQRSDRSDRSPVDNHQQPTHQKSSHSKPTQKVEDTMPSEELLELEDIIAQISDLNIRNDRSAAQIKRNILCSNNLIDTMEESDWEEVCQSMVSTALDQGEPEFIADLMVALFKNELFSAVMSDELMAASSKHIMENDDKPIPAFLSAILCAHWPRQYAKAFSNVNPILYTVVCIVKGWVEVVKEDTERFYKEEPKPKYQGREDPEAAPEKTAPEGEELDKTIEEPELVNKCAVALSELCDTAQRQLWVNWMQVTDEIYQCIKPAITHNPNIVGDVKARILDTFIQMNQWTKTKQAGIKHAGVQTVASTD